MAARLLNDSDTAGGDVPGDRLTHDERRVRPWRFPGNALVGVIDPCADAVAAVEIAERECEGRGETDRPGFPREALAILCAVM